MRNVEIVWKQELCPFFALHGLDQTMYGCPASDEASESNFLRRCARKRRLALQLERSKMWHCGQATLEVLYAEGNICVCACVCVWER